MSTQLLDSIEKLLQSHAAALDLTPEHKHRARSLAVAGTTAALLGITPAKLYELLAPGYEQWQRGNHSPIANNESNEVQQ